MEVYRDSGKVDCFEKLGMIFRADIKFQLKIFETSINKQTCCQNNSVFNRISKNPSPKKICVRLFERLLRP